MMDSPATIVLKKMVERDEDLLDHFLSDRERLKVAILLCGRSETKDVGGPDMEILKFVRIAEMRRDATLIAGR